MSIATINSDTLSFVSAGIRSRLFQSYGKNVDKLETIKAQIVDMLSEGALSDGQSQVIDSLRILYVGITEKPVFNIDLAAAFGASSLTKSYDDLELNRWGIWTSFNFRPKGDDFYFTILTRYINNEKFEGANVQADLIDLGTRFNYDILKFTVSLEYVHRMNLNV